MRLRIGSLWARIVLAVIQVRMKRGRKVDAVFLLRIMPVLDLLWNALTQKWNALNVIALTFRMRNAIPILRHPAIRASRINAADVMKIPMQDSFWSVMRHVWTVINATTLFRVFWVRRSMFRPIH